MSTSDSDEVYAIQYAYRAERKEMAHLHLGRTSTTAFLAVSETWIEVDGRG